MPPHRSYVRKLSKRANWLLTSAVVLKCVTLVIYLTGVGRRSKCWMDAVLYITASLISNTRSSHDRTQSNYHTTDGWATSETVSANGLISYKGPSCVRAACIYHKTTAHTNPPSYPT
jgi:hypothetical protein